MNLLDIQNTAVAIAQEAAELLRAGYGHGRAIAAKSSAIDLVTEYDGRAEALIVGRLREAFPDHRLVGEEGSQIGGDSPYVWIIDPLDGTTNFAHGFPMFAVSIALYERDKPLVGVVYDPLREECFAAAAGHGAVLIDGRGQATPLHVSTAATLTESLLATGFPYDRHTAELNNIRQLEAFLKRAQGIRRAGSAALDLAYVAAGRLDGYWEFKLYLWDMAAGALLVQEAGGRVTDIAAQTPGHPPGRHALVASNPAIHEAMLEVIQSTMTNDKWQK
jgi:myo-inositol-1(or 4)-monophosphatase